MSSYVYPIEHPGEILTRTANGAVTNKRFVLNNGQQAYATGQKVLGVARDSRSNGESVAVAIDGTVLVEAGAGIPADAEIMTDSQGRAIRATRGKYVAGRTMGSVSGAGYDVEVFLGIGAGTSVLWSTTTTTTTTAP